MHPVDAEEVVAVQWLNDTLHVQSTQRDYDVPYTLLEHEYPDDSIHHH